MRRLAVLSLITIVAACSSSGKSTPATTTSTTVATTTTIATASVQQVASVVAEHGQALADELTKIDVDCDPSRLELDDTGLEKITCNIEVMTLSPEASIMVTSLGKLTPPAEVESLVAETSDAAQALGAAAKAAGDAKCGGYDVLFANDGDPQGCTVKEFELQTASSTMRNKLNAWDPYL